MVAARDEARELLSLSWVVDHFVLVLPVSCPLFLQFIVVVIKQFRLMDVKLILVSKRSVNIDPKFFRPPIGPQWAPNQPPIGPHRPLSAPNRPPIGPFRPPIGPFSAPLKLCQVLGQIWAIFGGTSKSERESHRKEIVDP